MRRVVVTGLGIVSSIGTNRDEVIASLKAGTSGIAASPEMEEHGFRSRVAGTIDLDVSAHVDKRSLRFMGPGAAYAHIAMAEAIADAGLEEGDIVNPRTGEPYGRDPRGVAQKAEEYLTSSGIADTAFTLVCPLQVLTRLLLAMLHTLATCHEPLMMCWPSGVTATAFTQSVCPSKVWTSVPSTWYSRTPYG